MRCSQEEGPCCHTTVIEIAHVSQLTCLSRLAHLLDGGNGQGVSAGQPGKGTLLLWRGTIRHCSTELNMMPSRCGELASGRHCSMHAQWLAAGTSDVLLSCLHIREKLACTMRCAAFDTGKWDRARGRIRDPTLTEVRWLLLAQPSSPVPA